MSESGCLHNKKYENIKVEKRALSKQIIITGTHEVEQSHKNNISIGGDENPHQHVKVMKTPYDYFNRADGANSNADLSGSEFQAFQKEFDDNFLKRVDDGSDDKGGISRSFNNVFSERVEITIPRQLDEETLFNHYYIQWPGNTILEELIIIPNKDITIEGDPGGTTSVNISKKELVINLLTSTDYFGAIIGAMNANDLTTTLLLNLNNDIPGGGRLAKHAIDLGTAGVQQAGVFPAKQANPGAGHHTEADLEDFGGYAYLIREFPIVSYPTEAGQEVATNIIWRKYTPIAVIRDMGQPIQFEYDSQNQITHQHSTASTTNQLKHGKARATDTAPTPAGVADDVERYHIFDDTGGTDGSELRNNLNLRGELFSFSSSYRLISGKAYKMDELGSTHSADVYGYRNSMAYILQNGERTFQGTDNPQKQYFQSEEGDGNDNPNSLPHKVRYHHKSGMFYNSSDNNIALVLTIGQTLDETSGTPPTELPKGSLKVDDTDQSNNETIDGLRFKAIFRFRTLN